VGWCQALKASLAEKPAAQPLLLCHADVESVQTEMEHELRKKKVRTVVYLLNGD
jgi:hypothetical protein